MHLESLFIDSAVSCFPAHLPTMDLAPGMRCLKNQPMVKSQAHKNTLNLC